VVVGRKGLAEQLEKRLSWSTVISDDLVPRRNTCFLKVRFGFSYSVYGIIIVTCIWGCMECAHKISIFGIFYQKASYIVTYKK
jgi:hypothetical protein